ncbi:unnamed protein product [Moneuplotes crassus]|uniref:non-specific serine/threonine protein kinase n=1 Tax=Euplotes crassus TaxID=5936 RepID=A0AAD1U1X3_EUPCR|nr:unnamed protein product [Moneuplotes crassus]
MEYTFGEGQRKAKDRSKTIRHNRCIQNLQRSKSDIENYDFCDYPNLDYDYLNLKKGEVSSFSLVKNTSQDDDEDEKEEIYQEDSSSISPVKGYKPRRAKHPDKENHRAYKAKTVTDKPKEFRGKTRDHSGDRREDETEDETDKEKNDKAKEETKFLFNPNPMLERDSKLVDQFPDCTIRHFERVQYIGRGAFGNVTLVNCKLNNLPYALKEMSKDEISRQNRFKHLMREKDIMNKCSHNNIVRLETTLKDEENCYFVLEYHPIGDLAGLIRSRIRLSRSLTRFYAKEIISVLEYFQQNNIVHRDMKPDNILIDGCFHCKICDFGAAKIIDPAQVNEELSKVSFDYGNDSSDIDTDPAFELEDFGGRFSDDEEESRGGTFVGTPLYVSPEMLDHNIACFGSDLWGLGCIIYQCLTGFPPFKGETETAVFEAILEREVTFPDDMDQNAKDLIKKLLVKDPRERLGAGPKRSGRTLKDLKKHPFLKGTKCKNLYKKRPPVPRRLIRKVNQDYTKQNICNAIKEDDDILSECGDAKKEVKVFETGQVKSYRKNREYIYK